jgi:sporulation protein YlmC with PRC-barrel domain
MEDISSWVAPIATAIAACMTASNLGARVTGWGFVVFTVGSIAWTTYGAATGQTNLVWQNLFLTAVNLVGIWRWLGRQARLDEGARSASEKSEARPGPTLFPVSTLTSAALVTEDGSAIGSAVDAMLRCDDGRIDYLVVGKGGVGGLGETLHALPWAQVRLEPGRVVALLSEAQLDRLRQIEPADWPGAARGTHAPAAG